MINLHFSLYKGLWIKTDCSDRNLILDIQDFLTDYKKGFKFMPKYKAGVWDGKISLFNKGTRTFPYGLFVDVMKHVKKEWSDAKITIDDDIYKMWGAGFHPEYKYELSLKPYPFQQEVVEALVKCTKGIAVVATAGGKSLIISYIIRNLPKNQNKSLIIVPTVQLVDQFKGDMIGYGFDESEIGSVNSKSKEFDRDVVVSTWQSLKNNMDKLNLFDAVICDECVSGNTPIKTPNGDIPIKDINIGDILISYNKETGEYENDVVNDVFVNNPISSNDDMYELCFDDGSCMRITGNHEVFTTSGKVMVKYLTDDDNIISLSL